MSKQISEFTEQTLGKDEDLFVIQDGATTKNIKKSTVLELLKIGAPTYTTVQQMQDTFHSAGLTSGGGLSNNGDGTIAVAAGQGLLKSSDSDVGTLYACEWATDPSLALTDNAVNFIYLAYVDTLTDPTPTASTTEPSNRNQNIIVGTVYRAGNEIHITSSYRNQVSNHAMLMVRRLHETMPFAHASGAALTETGTRNIAVSAGSFWEGLTPITTIAQDTSGSSPDDNHTFEYFYRDGAGGWTTHEEFIGTEVFTGSGLDDLTSSGTFLGSHTIRIHVEITGNGTPDTYKWSYKEGATVIETTGVAIVGGSVNLIDGANITFAATTGHTIGDAWDFDCTLSSQIDNTQYDNNSGTLQTLANNKYGVHWVYLDIHGHIAVLFGQGDYTLAEAEDAASPTTMPPEFTKHVRIIGRIIIAKNASVFTLIENSYGNSFQGSVPIDLSAYALIDGAATIEIDQTTIDAPFLNFKATADADTTSAVSTLTTSGATTHHIQVDINGIKAWIAVSTTDPT